MENVFTMPGMFASKEKRVKTQEIKELISDLRELRNKRHQIEKENSRLLSQLDTLKAELSGADLVAASMAKEIEITKERINEYPELLNRLEAKKEELIEEINRCQSGMKTATKNIKNFLNMRSHLEDELLNIVNEKAVVIKKLRDMESGVNMLAQQKAQKAPEIKQYDMVLRQLSKVFKEVENRMDVSIKFSSKKTWKS